MVKTIGIDYGKKRVGIAISDSLQIIATGLDTISTKQIFVYLTDLLKKENVDCFVVGDPINLDGKLTDSTISTNEFIQKLARQYPSILIKRIDERFTSKIAKKTIIFSGVGKMRRKDKALVDKVSATIILQNYLDNK